jgi:hypothetical protein
MCLGQVEKLDAVATSRNFPLCETLFIGATLQILRITSKRAHGKKWRCSLTKLDGVMYLGSSLPQGVYKTPLLYGS